MPSLVKHVLIDASGNWQFQNTSAIPTPRAAVEWSGRARTDRDLAQWQDQGENVLFWLDKNGYPRFPGDGSGAAPTPEACTVYSVPGYKQPFILLALERPAKMTAITTSGIIWLGGVAYGMHSQAPSGYFGSLLTSLPANYPKPSF